MNPIVNLSDSGDVSTLTFDDEAVGQKDSSVVQAQRTESVSGDHQLVPAESDQLDLRKNGGKKRLYSNHHFSFETLSNVEMVHHR